MATLITRAGGFGPNASRRRIEVKRRDGTVLQADLLLYAITGDVKYNPYVLDGDAIRVPFQSLVATIGGAVNRPGRYELVGTLRPRRAGRAGGRPHPRCDHRASGAGGAPRAGREAGARSPSTSGPEAELPAVPMVREDSVWIPAFLELQQSVTITGALAGVAATAGTAGTTTALAVGGAGANAATNANTEDGGATRRLPFAQGDTVRSLLERVGGVGPLADLKGSYILRHNQAVPVDLYALVMLRDLSADKAVELGDTIVVPFKRPNVLIEGAVFKPGPYPYNPNYSVEQYLALAGGPNRFAQSTDNVYLVTPNGETKEFAPDLKVEPGASLVVPERNFSRSEVVAIILAGAGLAAERGDHLADVAEMTARPSSRSTCPSCAIRGARRRHRRLVAAGFAVLGAPLRHVRPQVVPIGARRWCLASRRSPRASRPAGRRPGRPGGRPRRGGGRRRRRGPDRGGPAEQRGRATR